MNKISLTKKGFSNVRAIFCHKGKIKVRLPCADAVIDLPNEKWEEIKKAYNKGLLLLDIDNAIYSFDSETEETEKLFSYDEYMDWRPETITVKDLIKELKKLPPDTFVFRNDRLEQELTPIKNTDRLEINKIHRLRKAAYNIEEGKFIFNLDIDDDTDKELYQKLLDDGNEIIETFEAIIL